MVVRGIDNLNDHATSSLSSDWSSFKKDFPSLPDSCTVTIYHFGFSESDGKVHVFAYRSSNGFVSERLPHGLAVKPGCEVHNNWELPKDFKTLMGRQRDAEAIKSESERIYIGGEIQVIHLTRDRCVLSSLGRFDDYEQTEESIYENFRHL